VRVRSAGKPEQASPLQVGVCHLPGDPAVSLTLAQAAEDAGFILSCTVPDPLAHIRLLGEDLQTRLNSPEQ